MRAAICEALSIRFKLERQKMKNIFQIKALSNASLDKDFIDPKNAVRHFDKSFA